MCGTVSESQMCLSLASSGQKQKYEGVDIT